MINLFRCLLEINNGPNVWESPEAEWALNSGLLREAATSRRVTSPYSVDGLQGNVFSTNDLPAELTRSVRLNANFTARETVEVKLFVSLLSAVCKSKCPCLLIHTYNVRHYCNSKNTLNEMRCPPDYVFYQHNKETCGRICKCSLTISHNICL